MAKDYVESRNNSFYLIGSRVPLARIVYGFRNGETAETIQSDYPTLNLEQVYGAITFYLANKEAAEKDVADRERLEDELMKAHPNPPGLKQKLLDRLEQKLTRQP